MMARLIFALYAGFVVAGCVLILLAGAFHR